MISPTHLNINNPHSRFKLHGSKADFDRIVLDMTENGGNLAPSSHWNWNLGKAGEVTKPSGYSDQLFQEKYKQLDLMLDPWVGVTGMKPIDDNAVAKYESFLRAIDHLELLPADILSHGIKNDWRETDLGTVMDCNLITAFSEKVGRSNDLTICEVGPGYGRLAEVLAGTVLGGSVHYVLIDAVPGSLMYSYLYLKNQLPRLKIGSYYQGDPYSTEFNCYIMPAWQVHQLPNAAFDICINVESLQEMEQHHVDHYLQSFDRLVRPQGLIYLSNARDYVFRGSWNIPGRWEPLFFSNTPRSWTADHPTHVYRRQAGEYAKQQRMLEGAFKLQVNAWMEHQRLTQTATTRKSKLFSWFGK